MTTHRLIVCREGRLIGHFDSGGTNPSAETARLAAALVDAGYSIEHHIAASETRLVEIGPTGARVLGVQREFVPT